MARLFGNIKRTIQGLTGKSDPYQEAITSAEAGQQEDLQEGFQETPSVETTPKLVVIGKESIFSKDIMDYAVDMADRMSYEIVALNTAPLSCDTFKLFSESRDKICSGFQMLAEDNVLPFKEAAEARGIPFTHIVKYTDSDEVLSELKEEIGEFEFVVSEEEPDAESNWADNEKRPRKEIFVYSVL